MLGTRNTLPMSRFILNQQIQSRRHQELRAITQSNSSYYTNIQYLDTKLTNLDAVFAETKAIAKKLGVQGTPTFLRLDGQHITANQFYEAVHGR